MARRTRTDITIPAGTDVTGLEDLIIGGPSDAPGAPVGAAPTAPPVQPKGPKMKEVTINGAKFLVPEEQAAVLEAQQAASDAQMAALRAELEAARKPAAPPRVAAPADEDDVETQLFINPKGTLDKFGQQIKAELTQQYTLEQARQRWWGDFYTAHPHLKGSNVIVEAVMNKNFAELEKLPVDKQASALADKVDDELAKIFKSRPKRDTEDKPAARPVEAASPVRGGPATPPASADEFPSDRVVSISEMQRNMRKRRLEARTGRAQG